ncbi:MAG: hypothetical protein H0U30_02045 [Actinobacteria bacterium]|nr:hypothetical protein [Actinomycetota bacterium]
MPAEQAGSIYATSTGYGVRWRDETGRRRRQSGFSSESKAKVWFRDVELPRMRGGLVDEKLSLAKFFERYLARYHVDRAPATVKSLQWRMMRPLAEFGDVQLSDLRTGEIAAFEATLPPRFRHDVMRAFRMLLEAAVAWEHLTKNPAKAVGRNPAPPVLERAVLEPADVERLAAEMHSPHDVAIVVGAWCYLRPSELLSLERRDVGDGELRVRGTKTARSRRNVPVPLRAAHALSELPPRLRYSAALPLAAGRALRRLQLAPAAVQLGSGGSRIRERDHALRAPALGNQLGLARRDSGERCGSLRGDERDDARGHVSPPALDERRSRESAAGRVSSERRGGG